MIAPKEPIPLGNFLALSKVVESVLGNISASETTEIIVKMWDIIIEHKNEKENT